MRRLIRRRAASQAFLNAVKGLGYHITTKNYKTFAEGAEPRRPISISTSAWTSCGCESKAVDTIVLVSGGTDFLPLLDFCTDHGVRVKVAAFDDAASMILRQSCSTCSSTSSLRGRHPRLATSPPAPSPARRGGVGGGRTETWWALPRAMRNGHPPCLASPCMLARARFPAITLLRDRPPTRMPYGSSPNLRSRSRVISALRSPSRS